MPNFTTEDLLVYIYGDMRADQQAELEAALHNDWALHQKYSVLVEAQKKLCDTPLHTPRAKTIHSILQYAEASLHITN